MRLTIKQDNFCLAMLKPNYDQSMAYKEAFDCENMTDKTVYEAASRLMNNSKIIARIAELRKPVVEKLQYTLEKAMEEAEQAFNVAKVKENGGAMVAAVQLRAKLNGLIIDKKEVRTSPLDDAQYEELIRIRDAVANARIDDAGKTSKPH